MTDRPDFTESSEIVGRGLLQFESGFNYEWDGDGPGREANVTVPASLLRIGLFRRVELRLGSDGFIGTETAGARVSGWADVEAGVKVRLFDQRTAGVDIAVIPMASLPTGRAGISSGGIDPTVKLTWARALPAGVGLSGNYNVSWLSGTDARFSQQALSLSVGRDLLLGWAGYLETYGFVPMDGAGDGAGWTLNGGFARPVGRNLQFDVEAGRGLTSAAPDWFVGFGFAVRGRLGAVR